jgi:DnaJ-related protein SCJ1
MEVNRQKICNTCDGHGTKNPDDVKVCNDCKGHGVRLIQKAIAPGFIQQFQTACNTCNGRGKIFKSTCSTCSGKKVVRKVEAISFKVPAGAPEGFLIVISFSKYDKFS